MLRKGINHDHHSKPNPTSSIDHLSYQWRDSARLCVFSGDVGGECFMEDKKREVELTTSRILLNILATALTLLYL